MKLTKETLKRIIKEELEAVMNEGVGVGQKTNAGSSRTQAYGDQTLGDTAAGQADRIKILPIMTGRSQPTKSCSKTWPMPQNQY